MSDMSKELAAIAAALAEVHDRINTLANQQATIIRNVDNLHMSLDDLSSRLDDAAEQVDEIHTLCTIEEEGQ